MTKLKYPKIIIYTILIALAILTITILFKSYYKVENRTRKINGCKEFDKVKPLGWLRVQGTNIDFPIVYYNDLDVTDPKYELGWNYSEETLDYLNTNINKEEEKKYIDKVINDSYFKFDVDVKETDHLITLVTCTRFFGNTTKYSFVVDARMVRKNERIKNYKVTENKSYKKIKKTLEGDVEDEEI